MANRQPTSAIGGIQPPPEEAYSDEYSYSESYSYSYSESNTGQLSHRLSSPSAARAAIPAAAATSPGNTATPCWAISQQCAHDDARNSVFTRESPT